MSLCNPASTCWGHVMVWTPETRHRVGDVGCGGRLSDAEFALLSPMLPPAKPGGRPRTTILREVLVGVWDEMLHVLRMAAREAEGREASPSAAIIDSQSVKTTERGGRAAGMPARR